MARYGRLEGTGFIVLNAREHSFEEFETLEAAQDEAGIMAGGPMLNGSGCAIIYAPVAIVRPQVASNVRIAPSSLMQQIGDLTRRIGGPDTPSTRTPVADDDHGTFVVDIPTKPASADPNDK